VLGRAQWPKALGLRENYPETKFVWLLVLDVSQSANETTNPDGGLIHEVLGAGDPVGAGADESALLRLIRTGPISICKPRLSAHIDVLP
jgi:hypothetical protein